MGILTGLRAVDAELYTDIVDSDNLKAFLDYLNGWAERSESNLPETAEFPRLSLDKGWDDIEYLLRSVTTTEDNTYKRYRFNIESYQKVYAFCWHEDEALIVLRSHRELCQALFERDWPLMEVKSRFFHPPLQLLSHSAFAESLLLLEAEIIKRVTEGEFYSELFNEPFNDATAEYVYSHYSNFMNFLMENLVSPEGEAKELVIIGLQS